MFIGVLLYLLLNWSYTTAVFTDPGSPTSSFVTRSGYSHLPTHEPTPNPDLPSFTVKSTGGSRFCKKCQARKPDRAHHCSSCRRCVLKMDHHCPWLATCVGHKNYKPFILFCTYTTLFCLLCFGVSASWLWSELFNSSGEEQGLLAINMVLLSVLSGILGLVLAGFTGWHISLACRGQTTIECLEKTRYLSPLRKSMQRHQYGVSDDSTSTVQRYGQQLAEIHANAIPGVTRIEEGEERASPIGDLEQGMARRDAPHMNYSDVERSRERQRYEEYLDEQDSAKLPNAFDLGWRRNLSQLFGDTPLFWLLPVCNTKGDGWLWEPSPKWLEAREVVRRQREEQWKDQEQREQEAGWGHRPNGYAKPIRPGDDNDRHYLTTSAGVAAVSRTGTRTPSKADQILGRSPNQFVDGAFSVDDRPGSRLSMKTIRRKSSFDGRSDDGDDQYEVSSDEENPGRPDGWYGQKPRDGQCGNDKEDQSVEDEWREWD